jgi:hypothetical protein
MDNKLIYIQVKNITGTWLTVNTVQNTDTLINKALDSAASFYKKQARAVTASGTVVNVAT